MVELSFFAFSYHIADAIEDSAHPGSTDSESLKDDDSGLSAEDEEEDHKVERRIGFKGFVHWAEPTDERAGGEQHQPQQT